MFAIDTAARRTAAVAAVQTLWNKATGSSLLFGLLAGAGLTLQLHEWSTSSLNLCLSSSAGLRQITQPDPVLAFTLYPVTAPAGQIAILAAAIAALIGFLLWSKRATSGSSSCGLRSRESSARQIELHPRGAGDPAAFGLGGVAF